MDNHTAGVDLDKLEALARPDLRYHDEYRRGYAAAISDVKELARRSTSGSDFTVRVDMERASSTAHKVSVSMASAASRKLSQEEVDALDRNPWASGSDGTAAAGAPVVPDHIVYGIAAYGNERADNDPKSAATFAKVITDIRVWAESIAAAPAPAAQDEQDAREFVTAIAHNYDVYDEGDDERYCRGCSALVAQDGATKHQPDCIVPRAQAWLAAMSQSKTQGDA